MHYATLDDSRNLIQRSIFQPAFTCSKLTIETLEKGVKYAQGNNKDIRTTPMDLSKYFGSIRGIYINYKMKQIIKSRDDRRSIPEEDN